MNSLKAISSRTIFVDAVNKPERALPSGRISRNEAILLTAALFLLALFLGWLVNLSCFLLAAAAAVLTTIYSVPPLRTKARGIWANITIAVPRGVLLKVAGWSCVKPVMAVEPWYIGLIFVTSEI